MVDIRVSVEAVRDSATRVDNGAADIEQRLQSLRNEVAGLVDSWEGDASQRFQDLYAQWDNDARNLHETLTAIVARMREVADIYETAGHDAVLRVTG
ncbi:WXG100 family type VII secretion target [Dactylosporangium sp. McL0621]|uniref:WXG100 family type VII secretion target n=1 Tax=Dactylosporangium sp. McL0621 TaxID=3415678 RepID=UPI003CF13A54